MSRRRAVPAVALLLAVAACDRQPTAPQIHPTDLAPLDNHLTETGPPNRVFGPDTRETGGPYTGQGVVQPGLACVGLSSGRRRCDGYLPSDVDGTLLDVGVDIPADPTPTDPNDAENVPLVVVIHGWAGSKNGEGAIVERLLQDGYAVLRYSARGFGNSFGRVNLVDVGVEVAPYADPAVCAPRAGGDLQSMIGEVVDRVLDETGRRMINADAVAVTGASYGGGHSWLATLRPRFNSPGGTCARIRTVLPIAAWTDLLYSLLPNGEPRNSVGPLGALKFSYVNALYFSGCRKDAGTLPCDNYPTYLKLWHAWLNAVEPNGIDPVYRRIRDGLAGYRSIWWQQPFWTSTAPSKLVPIFQVQGFTDDLFSAEEAQRMLLALERAAPGYPIKSYIGDIGHPRARNRPQEVEYVIERLREWLAFYLKGVGEQPRFQVQAAVTSRFGDPFNPGDMITVDRYQDLSTRAVVEEFARPAGLANPGSGLPSGPQSDPLLEVALVAAGELKPFPGLPPVPNLPDPTASIYEVPAERLGSPPVLLAGHPRIRIRGTTSGLRVQFDVRVYDVNPDRLTKELVTRGTLTAETRTFAPIGSFDVVVPTAGNLWRVAAGHTLQFVITNVDTPYLSPSKLASVTRIASVELTIPVNDGGTAIAAR